jgi:uncharacterized protein
MATRATPCPSCKKPVEYSSERKTFPFCSEKCKLVDLGNWLDGRYRVQSEAPFSEGESDLPEAEEEKEP